MPSFLFPVFLAGAAAVAIPIVLHLLRRDVAPEVPFTAVRLLRRTPLEQTRRRRLRELLLLAARVAALLLLAAAFARPYFTAADDAPLEIVAIDRSYSMGAPGVFERARALAEEAIESAGSGRIAVIAFDDGAEVVAAPGGASAARAAVRALQPGTGSTRYAAMLSRALELGGAAPSRLIVVSDLQRAGWENEAPFTVPPGLQVETRDTGSARGNAAVVAVRREQAALVGTIRNDGPEPIAGEARVVMEGRPAGSARFSVPAGASVDVPVLHQLPPRGAAAFAIEDRTGYAADNTRHLVLDPQAPARIVAVVSDPNRDAFYVSRALRAASAGDPLDVQVRSAAAFGAMPAPELTHTRAVLLLSTRGLDRRGRESIPAFVRSGGGLLISASEDVEPSVLSAIMGWRGFSAADDTAGDAVLAATDLRHPIFRPFGPVAANLGQVRFSRTWRVRGEGWEVAARFTDGSPALLERREGEGRIVLFASDLERRWNDFPLHPTFVPFAMEAVRYVARPVDERREYVAGQAPAGAGPEPGSYVIGEDGRRVAVNVDLRESAPGRMTSDEFAGMLRPGQNPAGQAERQARDLEARQDLWRYGLLLMLAVLVAESFVGRVTS
jgi:hypothetical protein